MSKYVKQLVTDALRERFKEVDDALLVNMIGLDANANNRLRSQLAEKDIQVLVVKNSLARRAAAGTPLAAMFEGLTGSSAVCWGSEDIVSLAKEITRLARDDTMAPFEPRGGVMDGQKLSAAQVRQVSSWPSRPEQLSLLVGQILGPGAGLAAQLGGPGGALAYQIGEQGGKSQDDGQEETDGP